MLKQLRTLRKLFALFVTVLLVTQSWVVFNAKANATIVQAASDTMTRHKVSTGSNHTIVVTLSAAQTLAANETMTFTWKDLPSAGTWSTTGNFWGTGSFTLNDGSDRGNPVQDSTGPSCIGHDGVNDYVVTHYIDLAKFSITTCGSWTASSAGATVTFAVANVSYYIINPATAGRYEIWVTGNFGDTQSEAEVPILDDDQVSVAATVDTYISFNVTTSNGSDNAINLGELNFAGNPSGSVTSSNDATRTDQAGATLPADNISLTLDTNAFSGTSIQVKSLNGGLKSTANSYTLTSASETLAINQNTVSDTAGYGLQAQTPSTTQGSMGNTSPYSGSGTAVGIVDSTFRSIYNTNAGDETAAIVGGTASVYVLAVPAKNTPAGDDYADTLTFRATSTF